MKLQVGVKVLIKNSLGEYLFIKRSKLLASDTSPSWDIPGGRIGPTETLGNALRRELLEEIGHELDSEPSILLAQDIFVEKQQLHVVRLTYIVEEEVANVTLGDEHTDYAWFSPERLRDMKFEPYLQEALQLHVL